MQFVCCSIPFYFDTPGPLISPSLMVYLLSLWRSRSTEIPCIPIPDSIRDKDNSVLGSAWKGRCLNNIYYCDNMMVSLPYTWGIWSCAANDFLCPISKMIIPIQRSHNRNMFLFSADSATLKNCAEPMWGEVCHYMIQILFLNIDH
jgi:hypothetical protein